MGTPVDAELAAAGRPTGLIRSIGAVVDGSDTERPDVLGYLEGPYPTGSPERESTIRWIDGYQFYPDDCDGGHIVDPCQLGTGADPADTPSSTAYGPVQPYVIEATDRCSTFGAPREYRQARALRKLLAVQSKVLESEFWNGTKAQSQGWTNNQYLRNPTGLTVLGTAPVGGVFGYVDGLAALEQAISDGSASGRGVIHASPQLVTHWIGAYLVTARPTDGILMTGLGTIVVAGAGYNGSGPQGGINPNRIEWAYATPIPQIRLGEITFNETDEDSVAVDRSTNDRTVRAARFAAISFSPCFRAAALISMVTANQVPGS